MLVLPLVAFVTALVGLQFYLRLAPGAGFIDTPNERSLHDAPTVVGAGVMVVVAVAVGWMLLPDGVMRSPALVVGLGLGLAVVGLTDDRYGLPSAPRLILYGIACVATVTVEVGQGWLWVVVLSLSLLWVVNLFNFMDGADGFAGLQAAAVALGMGLLSLFGPAPGVSLLWWVLLAALIPFLWLNWPPARCFMGDGGSVPLGFFLGLGGLASTLAAPLLGVAWLILMMPFLVDATVTLLLRLLAGHAPHHPHRDHAYQRAARQFGSPLPVDLALAGLHLAWQFPLAVAAVQLPTLWPILVILSAIPTLLSLVYLRRAA